VRPTSGFGISSRSRLLNVRLDYYLGFFLAVYPAVVADIHYRSSAAKLFLHHGTRTGKNICKDKEEK
jgi:hypothetical protein